MWFFLWLGLNVISASWGLRQVDCNNNILNLGLQYQPRPPQKTTPELFTTNTSSSRVDVNKQNKTRTKKNRTWNYTGPLSGLFFWPLKRVRKYSPLIFLHQTPFTCVCERSLCCCCCCCCCCFFFYFVIVTLDFNNWTPPSCTCMEEFDCGGFLFHRM